MDRHRKYQILITSGVVATAVCAMVAPHFELYAVVGSVMTNILWIWER